MYVCQVISQHRCTFASEKQTKDFVSTWKEFADTPFQSVMLFYYSVTMPWTQTWGLMTPGGGTIRPCIRKKAYTVHTAKWLKKSSAFQFSVPDAWTILTWH